MSIVCLNIFIVKSCRRVIKYCKDSQKVRSSALAEINVNDFFEQV